MSWATGCAFLSANVMYLRRESSCFVGRSLSNRLRGGRKSVEASAREESAVVGVHEGERVVVRLRSNMERKEEKRRCGLR